MNGGWSTGPLVPGAAGSLNNCHNGGGTDNANTHYLHYHHLAATEREREREASNFKIKLLLLNSETDKKCLKLFYSIKSKITFSQTDSS